MDYPKYYKNIRFVDVNGKAHFGYFEPPFEVDESPLFAVSDSADYRQGCGGIFYHPNDVLRWEYTNPKDYED